jgi:hypothetical protein
MTAAIWSAVAAIFAAISSFLIFLIQRENLRASVRPELILTDWERHVEGEGDAAREVLCFRNIRNVGRGAAMHVNLNLAFSGDPPTAALGTISRPILAPGDVSQVDAQISLWWQNVAPQQGTKFLHIKLVIFNWDSVGNRYETRYGLLVVELRENVNVAWTTYSIAPGVTMGSRHVTSRSVWFLKLSRRVQRHWERVQDFFVQKNLPQIAKAQKLAREWWAKHKKK